MTHHIRFGLSAALVAAALTLAGCQRDGAPGATGIDTPPPAAPPEFVAVDPPRFYSLPDAAGGASLAWYDAEGRRYEVVTEGDDPFNTRHYRDGELFGATTSQDGGADFQAFRDGVKIDNSFIAFTFAGPSAASAQRPPRREDRDDGTVRERQMLIPCEAEIGSYLAASAALIFAAEMVRRNPLNSRYRMALKAAIANWGLAWFAMYQCFENN